MFPEGLQRVLGFDEILRVDESSEGLISVLSVH